MGASTFAAAVIRVGLAIGAAGLAGRQLARGLGYGPDALGRLAAAVLALSAGLVSAELLGLAGALRSGPLIALLVVFAGAASAWSVARRGRLAPGVEAGRADAPASYAWSRRAVAAIALAITLGQWLLATADSLGGGMYNFDTLWYHMPFAARFAQSGSITAIHFTQADPWVAYYPANSELVHAIGLVLVHGDLLSPLINLGWLALLLLGAWCVGRPWGRAPETLVAGALAAGLPVLASTQPGEAFNDIAGLGMLVAAAALVVNGGSRVPAVLALGFALGVKVTFIVPVVVLAAAALWRERSPRRAAGMGAAVLITGGWWYLRDLVRVGNPLGARVALGPITLPGPPSPLAASSQQTVVSQLRHTALWGSRFVPGLTHMFGVLWPVLFVGAAGAVVTALARTRRGEEARTAGLALAAAAAAVTYLFLPTGATGLGTGTVLFEVNLRYAMPALAVGLLIAPLAPSTRTARLAAAVMLAALVAAQAEPSLWPAAPARHLAFVALALGLSAAALVSLRAAVRIPGQGLAAGAGVGAAIIAFGAGYAIQRHYLDRRYRTSVSSDARLGEVFNWAQTVSHARIALYGTVEQYPLYGALVTNRVDYLGAHTTGGGYAPITACAAWRTAIDRDRAQYVVMTPGPTGTAPLSWTQADPVARVVLAPGSEAVVFALSGPLDPRTCPRG